MKTILSAVLFAVLAAALPCPGQLYSNVLVNPGFEAGTSELDIDGWFRFGNAYRHEKAGAHEGSYVVVAWGNWWPTNPPDWNASGAYQEYPTSRGDIWEGSVWALAETPVTGRLFAAVNLEFYNAAHQVIFSASSAAKIDSASPTGQWFQLKIKARAALNTAWVRVIPVLIQSPDFEGGAAWLDDCALYKVPTSTVTFAGQEWIVNDGSSSPGENYYSTNCVRVDSNGWLHMEVKQIDGTWYCPFLESMSSPGFGEYRWYVGSRVDLLDSNLVAGLFNYAQESVFNTNQIEVDIEFSRGLPGTQTNNLLFTVQPYTIAGNSYQHPMDLTNELTTHKFFWRPDRVDWLSYYGHTPEPLDTNHTIAGWRFENRGIPIETNERAYMNLWLFYTNQPAGTQGLEMIIRDFAFTPFDGFLLTDDFDDESISNLWDVVGTGVEETNGSLGVTPRGPDPSGVATVNRVHRNERGSLYVFSARLGRVSAIVAGAGEDVRAIMTLSAETNDAHAAGAAAILQGRYEAADDTMTFAFFTKTNSPGVDGTLRFEGLVTNVAALLTSGGLDMVMALSDVEYCVEARDAAGSPIALATNSGAATGLHGLGENVNYGFWFVGAQNGATPAEGIVSWDRAILGIGGQAEPFVLKNPAVSGGRPEFRAPGFFDTKYTVLRTTNLLGSFLPVATGCVGTSSSITFTDDLPVASGAYYRMELE